MNSLNSELIAPFPRTLSGLLELWRDITTSEAKAIEAGDWDSLQRAHTTKLRLMNAIDAMPSAHASIMQPHLQTVRALQAAERANAETLEAKLKALRAEIEALDQSSRALRDVRSAYGHSGQGLWQSYS